MPYTLKDALKTYSVLVQGLVGYGLDLLPHRLTFHQAQSPTSPKPYSPINPKP